jgi:hypothetical protein
MALGGWGANAGDGESREAKCAFNVEKNPDWAAFRIGIRDGILISC